MFGALRQIRLAGQRLQATFSRADIELAKKWLDSVTPSQVPKHEFDITYVRASGPGGQKVNKTSSKASVLLDPAKWLGPDCYWVPQPVQSQLQQKPVRYQTKFGGLLIQCDTSRNREANTIECFSRLIEEIRKVVHFDAEVKEEDRAKWDEIARDRAEKIKFQKKRQSDKKKLRLKKFDV